MANQSQNNTQITVILGILGAAAIICGAIIGLAQPFVENIADSPTPSVIASTEETSQILPTSDADIQLTQSLLTTQPLGVTQVPANECFPPADLGLIHLNERTNPEWSTYIWVSENVLDFIVDRGIINASDPDFGEFQIWIGPCEFQLSSHGFEDGDKFWSRTPGVSSDDSPIIHLGELTTISLESGSGLWGLGKRLRLP
jgi:hypothetical protein